MPSSSRGFLSVPTFTLLLKLCFAQSEPIIIPSSNGTYNVGLVTTQITNQNSLQPFAPAPQPPVLELSIFYPTSSNQTVPVPYMPAPVAQYNDVEQAEVFYLNTPNGTFERLLMQLAPNGSAVASDDQHRLWPILLFGTAQGTNRHFYNALNSQISSSGFVVVSYDTPYDTDIVLYSDGSVVLANSSITPSEENAVADVNVRAQDASYIIDQMSSSDFVSNLIPGCKQCLDLSRVGIFGHSIGGAAAATAMLNDTRIAGALNYDGALWGDVVQQGLNKPFMLMVTEGQTRAAVNASLGELGAGWELIWPKLTSAKFDLILNNSAHYTYSDHPLVFDLLGILPTNTTTLDSVHLTTMNGTRAHHIVTTYTTAFFNWLFWNGTAELLETPNASFPEITLDTDTTKGNATNGTGSSDDPPMSSGATRLSEIRLAVMTAIGLMGCLLV